MEHEYEASFQTLWYVLKKRIVLIAVIGVIFGIISCVVSMYVIPPKYSSTAKFYAFNNSTAQSSITNQDISAAQSLVETYIVVLTGDTALEQVAEAAGVRYSPAQLKNMITTGSVSGTEVFKITVKSTSPAEALKIAEAFVDVVPREIVRVVNAGGVQIMDEPKLDTVKDSPNVLQNTVIVAVAAAVVSFAIFFLTEVLDVTVYTEDDLKRAVDYPILGVIPTFDDESEASGGKRRRRKKRRSTYEYSYSYGYGSKEKKANKKQSSKKTDASEKTE